MTSAAKTLRSLSGHGSAETVHARSIWLRRPFQTARSQYRAVGKRRSTPWICHSSAESEGEQVEETEMAADVCAGCGVNLADAPRGCDREGHIASGIGAMVGFEWWPIKVYRPCPAYEATGKTYVRKGQITNEILFKRKDRSEI